MKKRKTLKWLVVFIGVLLVSFFFSRTVQTITTPKVQKVMATRGKLEEKIPLPSTLAFAQGLEVFARDAKKLNILFTEVPAQQGYFVKEGDLLAVAEIPTLQEEQEKIQEEYEKAIREMGEHIAGTIRLAQDSPHNQVYEAYFVALQAYYDQRLLAEVKAAELKYELPADMQAWGRSAPPEVTPRPQANPTPSPVPLARMPEGMKQVMQDTYDLWQKSEAAFQELRGIYTGRSQVRRTGDATFEFIKKLDGFKRTVAQHAGDMTALSQLADGLREFRAPHSGYLTIFPIKAGDTYDGSKAMYTISKEDQTPSLKVDITDVKKTIEKGNKVEIADIRDAIAVAEIKLEANNKKFAYITLTEDLIAQLGGVTGLMNNPPQVTLVYKSAKTTTLLPASAVRTDADGSSFIYTIQQNWGGMLGNMRYVLKKQNVTVLEQSNRMVAVGEDLSYTEIADKEDRAVADGQVVMEYVD